MDNPRGLENRLIDYGVAVIRLADSLRKHPSYIKSVLDQLVRSGTAVGANYEEASAAESDADFVHKLQLSLKESRESLYWLRIIDRIKPAYPDMAPLLQEAVEIRAIMSKSVATAKFNRGIGRP